MHKLKPNSLEAAIFQLLAHGQLSLTLLYSRLNARKDVINKTLKRMQASGLIHIDILPNVTYVSLVRTDVQHQGIKPMRAGFKQKSRPPREDNRAYG